MLPKIDRLRSPYFLIILKNVMMIVMLFTISSKSFSQALKVDKQIAYCRAQILKTLNQLPQSGKSIPRSIGPNDKQWQYVNYKDWCSGFWPGILWYAFEGTRDESIKLAANKYTALLEPLAKQKASDHDLGFQIFNSYGNGYRLVGDSTYKAIILRAADTLATLYNPNVGTILSWPRSVKNMQWPQHNTIIDNMINLELLFWASKNGGNKRLYEIAESHALVTMKNHFRPDYTSYHAVIYDKKTGQKIKGLTHQGFADHSTWARGQAWAIYGYTMCFRETNNKIFLDFAQKVTDVYLDKLPKDFVPFWDFDDPNIPNAPKDASAAAVVASALIELASFVKDKDKSDHYLKAAKKMLLSLSSKAYQSRSINNSFLLHSTGHFPNNSEVDYSIIYADYYYLEALLRWKNVH